MTLASAAFLAAPALAATTFTVSPGGAWSGTQAADFSVIISPGQKITSP